MLHRVQTNYDCNLTKSIEHYLQKLGCIYLYTTFYLTFKLKITTYVDVIFFTTFKLLRLHLMKCIYFSVFITCNMYNDNVLHLPVGKSV